jgi:hypothetical protein
MKTKMMDREKHLRQSASLMRMLGWLLVVGFRLDSAGAYMIQGRGGDHVPRSALLTAALAGIVTGLSWPVGDPHRRLGAAALEAGEREEKGLGQVNRPPQRTTRSRR